MSLTVETWMNQDGEDTYALDIQIQGYKPNRHGDEATLRKILKAARQVIADCKDEWRYDHEGDGAESEER